MKYEYLPENEDSVSFLQNRHVKEIRWYFFIHYILFEFRVLKRKSNTTIKL